MINAEEIVTVVNRCNKRLTGTWGGRQYDFEPYPAQTPVQRVVAVAARFQNPIMGRGTPMEDWSSKSEYLLGIVEDSDPITPITQSASPQRWDSDLVNGSDAEIIPVRGSRAEVRQAAKSAEVGFAKP